MKKITLLLAVFAVVLAIAGCAKKRNQAPEIQGAKTDVTISVGEQYDPLDGVVVTDDKDDDIEIKVVGTYNVNSVGTYNFKLTAEDSEGAKDEVAMKLTVNDPTSTNTPPTLVGVVPVQNYFIGSGTHNPLTGITAIDAEDDNITDISFTITEGGSTIDYTTAGSYVLTITAKDSEGASTSATVVLNIIAPTIPSQLSSEPITVTFWHAFGADKEALIKEYAAQFKSLYPNVTIELASQGGYDELLSKVTASIVAGTEPTMLIGYPDHASSYLAVNAVEPLDEYVTHPSHGIDLSDFVQSYITENKSYDEEQTLYGLPFNKSTEIFIYNKTYFTQKGYQVPTTWAEVEAIAEQIKEEETADDVYAFAYDSAANAFITLTRQWGGEYTDIDSNGDGIIKFGTDTKVKEMLTYLDGLAEDNYFILPSVWEQDYASEPFTQKKVFMTVGSIAGLTYNIPKDGSFDIGVAPIPQKDENNKAVIQQGTNIMLMKSAPAQEKLAAWLFTKYLTSTEITADWAMKSGYLPVRTSALESVKYQNFLTFDEAYQSSQELKDIAIAIFKSKPANLDKETGLPKEPTQAQINTEINNLKYASMASNAAFAQRDYMFVDQPFIGSSDVRKEVDLMLDTILVGSVSIENAIKKALDELK